MRFTRALSTYLECRIALSGVRSGCSPRFAGGWHQVEASGSDWLRWSDGTGGLKVFLREPADLVLETDVLSLSRPNTIDVMVDDRLTASWSVIDTAWAFHQQPPVAFHAAAGETSIRFVSHQPAATQPNDPRALAFAVRNLRLRSSDGTRMCDLAMANCPGDPQRSEREESKASKDVSVRTVKDGLSAARRH
jgi:hypothetical protein